MGWGLLANLFDSNWQLWLLAIAALAYGAIILTMIIVLVLKSGQACYREREKASKVE
jgi:hypothetical protein